MKIAVGVIDAVLGTVVLTPRGLEIDGPERETLERLVEGYRSPNVSDREVIERMLARLQGYTWAVEVNEGKTGLVAYPGRQQEATRGVDRECGFCPIEIDDSWLDPATS